MGYLEQSQKSGRVLLPDLVRAWALFGIAVVNVGLLSYPMGSYMLGDGLVGNFNKIALFLVNALFLFKSYSLFSLMFGVGLGYQMSSAEKQGASFGRRYWRRILGLFILGFLHVALLFQGDILMTYAIMGAILYLFRNYQVKTLMIWAIALYIFQTLVIGTFAAALWAGETYAPDEMAKEFAKVEDQMKASAAAFEGGSFRDAMMQRLSEWSKMILFVPFIQGFGVFSFFLFGLAAMKSGIIHDPENSRWSVFRKFYLPIGLIGSAWGAWYMLDATSIITAKMMTGMLLIVIFSPFSTAGYLGVLAKFSQGSLGSVKTFFARGGTSSLTAYLLQGLLMSFIFNNYGLGLFAKLGAGYCILIGALVAIFTIVFASLWRTKFRRGPMEVLLRRWTYFGEPLNDVK